MKKVTAEYRQYGTASKLLIIGMYHSNMYVSRMEFMVRNQKKEKKELAAYEAFEKSKQAAAAGVATKQH